MKICTREFFLWILKTIFSLTLGTSQGIFIYLCLCVPVNCGVHVCACVCVCVCDGVQKTDTEREMTKHDCERGSDNGTERTRKD